jgi:hypothetical protein
MYGSGWLWQKICLTAVPRVEANFISLKVLSFQQMGRRIENAIRVLQARMELLPSFLDEIDS